MPGSRLVYIMGRHTLIASILSVQLFTVEGLYQNLNTGVIQDERVTEASLIAPSMSLSSFRGSSLFTQIHYGVLVRLAGELTIGRYVQVLSHHSEPQKVCTGKRQLEPSVPKELVTSTYLVQEVWEGQSRVLSPVILVGEKRWKNIFIQFRHYGCSVVTRLVS